MYEISKHLTQDVHEAVLLQAWAAYSVTPNTTIRDLDKIATMRQEITSILYTYIERWNLNSDLMPICIAILQKQDVKHFKKFNEYNYNKLLITLHSKKDT